ncbi:5-formyltetrahydrofolate cyclo-ligase [Leucobacter insecticola]|uniref:5-formyltetrahydrofolate cyclo-ligase n=1 Tax=Leucobacter insecticola TaxID=2714934 RepID=A0A6G8FFJ6_9MICO|nr:5-formyltetrahydrofolate cyclo-ligase [Leucobacter insecticola]QIM15216.1 5-formyltetrahydrofolate cyclo-ligase [Leucobacter insecticola]
MTETINSAKLRIRESVRSARAARSAADRIQDRIGLTAQLRSLVEARGARSITCYLPVHGEPDTTSFVDWARDEGIDVMLPVSREDRRLDWALLSEAGTVAGRYGIQEPVGPRLPAEAAAQTDLLIIPACAVDVTGMRLGWGLGYYDRLLASLTPCPPVFAVVFGDEILPLVPAEAHDTPVSGAVTPHEIRVFTSKAG